jgi:hypothetical protein
VCEVKRGGNISVQISIVSFGLDCEWLVIHHSCWHHGVVKCWYFVTGVMLTSVLESVTLVMQPSALDSVTEFIQPCTTFCVWDFPTVSTAQRNCCSAAQYSVIELFVFYCEM